MLLEQRLLKSVRDIPDFPKAGILFKDITPVLLDTVLCHDITEAIWEAFRTVRVDGIIGIESRGFFFGMMLSQRFNVPFIPVRKKGKLPYKTVSYEYTLEYGTAMVEMHQDVIVEGNHYLVHDDLLATGGTAAAAAELIAMQRGRVAGFAFLIGLDFLNGDKVLQKYSQKITSLIHYNN